VDGTASDRPVVVIVSVIMYSSIQNLFRTHHNHNAPGKVSQSYWWFMLVLLVYCVQDGAQRVENPYFGSHFPVVASPL
jgi:hypothetical protein